MDWEEVEKRLKREAVEEEALKAQADRDAKMDKAFDDEFGALFGMSTKAMQEEISKNIPDVTKAEVKEAMAAIAKARKELKRGNSNEAEKILMSSRGIREVQKNKSKGCAVILLLLVGASSSTALAIIAGAIEVIQAVAR